MQHGGLTTAVFLPACVSCPQVFYRVAPDPTLACINEGLNVGARAGCRLLLGWRCADGVRLLVLH